MHAQATDIPFLANDEPADQVGHSIPAPVDVSQLLHEGECDSSSLDATSSPLSSLTDEPLTEAEAPPMRPIGSLDGSSSSLAPLDSSSPSGNTSRAPGSSA
ncbi:unnamed protein product [Linum trigynum]|uniref:Uncharacterized protein n=1 Tax=Linum trigynum TaxID=586398 RepID=A0AAV2G9S3_9ROSI